MNRKEPLRQRIVRMQNSMPASLGMAGLALIATVLLMYELFQPDRVAPHVQLFHMIDLIVAWIFLGDFTLGMALAGKGNHTRYLKDNWLNLASSVPIPHDVFRILRILRIIRAARTIRAIRAVRAGINVRQALKKRNNHT